MTEKKNYNPSDYMLGDPFRIKREDTVLLNPAAATVVYIQPPTMPDEDFIGVHFEDHKLGHMLMVLSVEMAEYIADTITGTLKHLPEMRAEADAINNQEQQ